MNIISVSPWIIRLAIIIALPTMACTGFYSVNKLQEVNGVWAVLTSLAYPTILICMVGLASQLLSAPISKTKVLIWSVAITFPLGLLVYVWW